MALASTGLTASSPQNFVIDAATIFKDFAYSGTEFVGTALGATSGGVKVSIETEYRQIEVDGAARMDVKGLKVMDSAKCKVTAPLKEFTAETLRRSLNGTIAAASGSEAPAGYSKVTTKRYVQDADYIPTIGIVGKLAGSGQPVVLVLTNALATNALEMEFKDGEEAVIEQELTAHASIDQLNADQFPWAIYFPSSKPNISTVLPVSQGATKQVTLTGTGFNGATAVTFGGTAATAFTVVSDSTIVATLPAGSAGPVPVVVTTPIGVSASVQYTRVV